MAVGVVFLTFIFGIIATVVLRALGCGWWSLFGLLAGSLITIAVLAADYKIQSLWKNRKTG